MKLHCDDRTNGLWTHETPGVVTRAVYAASGNTLNIYLHAKNSGINTYGELVDSTTGIGFVTGAVLQLDINLTNAVVWYNGTNVCSGLITNANIFQWPQGGVCVVEVSEVVTGSTDYVQLDNFRAWHDDSIYDTSFLDDFSAYPEGIAAVAMPENNVLRRWNATSAGNGYITNAALLWIPKNVTEGGSWYAPRRDYCNSLRLNLTATNVVEARCSLGGFSDGIARIGILPEDIPGEMYDSYQGDCLYAKIDRTNANVRFRAYRQWGADKYDRICVGGTNYATYVEGEHVSLQVSTNEFSIYYGNSLVTNGYHNLTNMLTVYNAGAYPQYEYQNPTNASNCSVLLDDVISQTLDDFEVPLE